MLNLIWKDIVGYEGKYQVSNSGLVKSLQREVPTSRGNGVRTVKERVIAQKLDSKNRYKLVVLWSENKAKTHLVHRLVAEAFCPKQEHQTEVNHINGIKLKNNADNLEWCTSSENKQHAWDTGLATSNADKMFGKKVGKSKFHNVTWNVERSKWLAGIKYQRKTYGQKRFDSEIEAALHVDKLLDEVGDTKRPRNSTLINA